MKPISITKLCILATVLILVSFLGNTVYSAPDSPKSVPQPQIVGGIDAARGSWPWMAEVIVDGNFRCGGSFINMNYVLTAVHCLEDVDNPNRISVIVGGVNRGLNEAGEEKRVVSLMTKHRDFRYANGEGAKIPVNDVAILYLRNPIYSATYIKPINWTKSPQNDDLLRAGKIAVIAGWGRTSTDGNGPPSNVLKQADVSIIDNSECNQVPYLKGLITENMICIERKSSISNNGILCYNDSGGPLIVQSATGEWLLGGIASASDCNRYGVYTRVSSYDSLINEVAGQQTTLPRIGIITGNYLLVKEGGLSTDWKKVYPDNEYPAVIDFQLSDGRIGVLTTDRVLRVKEGGLSAGWITEYESNVSKFQISGNRIGILVNGTILVKEGGLSEGWYYQANAPEFQLSGNRIGILSNGTLYVKEGRLDAGWVNEYSSVKKFQLEGNRIGVLLTDGTLLVKEGALNAGWTNEYGSVDKFQLEGDRIGILLRDKTLMVKEGPLNAGWYYQYGDVRKFLLENKRIGALTGDGTLRVKEGSPNAGFVVEYTNVHDFSLMTSY